MAKIVSSCPTLDSFNSFLKTYGVSSSNIFDVLVDIPSNTELYTSLKSLGTFQHKNYNPLQWISFFTDDVQLPGAQVSTSSYRFNSSPAYKYATDTVYPEVTITLLLDSFMDQKKVFDKWIDFIKPISAGTSKSQLLRQRYKDDYVCDIRILKYERYIYGNFDTGIFAPSKISYMKNEQKANIAYAPSPVYRYSTVLKNAFPTTMSNISLSSGSMQLNRVSITFNYDYPIFSSNQKLDVSFDTTGAIENRRINNINI